MDLLLEKLQVLRNTALCSEQIMTVLFFFVNCFDFKILTLQGRVSYIRLKLTEAKLFSYCLLNGKFKHNDFTIRLINRLNVFHLFYSLLFTRLSFPRDSAVKNRPAGQETLETGLIPGWEDPLEEGMITHSSILFLKNLFIFKWKDICFTELCWFLPNINMNQP